MRTTKIAWNGRKPNVALADLTPAQRRLFQTAFHEAGHALMHLLCGSRFDYASVRPRLADAGRVVGPPAEGRLMVVLLGGIAGRLFLERKVDLSDGTYDSDLAEFIHVANEKAHKSCIADEFRWQLRGAAEQLLEHNDSLKVLARELVLNHRVTYRQATRLLSDEGCERALKPCADWQLLRELRRRRRFGI